MYQQTQALGVMDKVTIATMTIVLFIAGFFATLLALAVGGSLALFALGKAWWLNRRTDKHCIEGEYEVMRE